MMRYDWREVLNFNVYCPLVMIFAISNVPRETNARCLIEIKNFGNQGQILKDTEEEIV